MMKSLKLIVSSILLVLSVFSQTSSAEIRPVFDIDGNGETKPLSDGLLTLRYLFGFRGDALINQAIGAEATRTTSNEIETFIDANVLALDIDGNGQVKPLSDGLLILRYLFGFRGDALIAAAIGEGATRTTAAEIEAYISPDTLPTVTGQIIESGALKGLSYTCSSGATGLTDQNGLYSCNEGDDVTFSLGSVVVGNTVAAKSSIITPLALFTTEENNTAAFNFAILLQALNLSTDPDLIDIDMALIEQLPAGLDFTAASFESDVQTALGITLIPLEETIGNFVVSILTLGGTIELTDRITQEQIILRPSDLIDLLDLIDVDHTSERHIGHFLARHMPFSLVNICRHPPKFSETNCLVELEGGDGEMTVVMTGKLIDIYINDSENELVLLSPKADITMSDTSLIAGETSQVTIKFTGKINLLDDLEGEQEFIFTPLPFYYVPDFSVKVDNGTIDKWTTADNLTWVATFTPTESINETSNNVNVEISYCRDVFALGCYPPSRSFASANYTVDTTASPLVNPVAASSNQNTAIDITLLGSDADGDTLTYSVVANPTSGTVSITDDTASYTPNLDFIGSDSFTYKANDGSTDSNIETVSITVTEEPLLSFTTPSASTIGTLDISGAQAVKLSSDGTKAYVVSAEGPPGTSGLQIIYVSDPAVPVLLARLDTSGAYDIALSADGTKAYVADLFAGLRIINISNPVAPVLLGTLDTIRPVGVTLSSDGTLAYVGVGSTGMQIIDVSNPALPILLSTFDNQLVLQSGNAKDVALSNDGTIAYVADGRAGVHIINVSDPAAPLLLGNLNIGAGDADSVTLSSDGSIVYVGCQNACLKVFNVSDPAAPVLLGSLDTHTATDIVLASDGNIAYAADRITGLRIIDVSTAATPVSLGTLPGTSNASNLALSEDGTKAYVVNNSRGLSIVDLSTPIVPVLLGSLDGPNSGFNFKYNATLSSDGTKAYLAHGESGLKIVDVSSPAAPLLLGAVNTLSDARDVALTSDGTKAYVLDGSTGLHVFNVSDPTAPALLGTLATLTNADSITLSDNETIGYVANNAAGLQIVDLSTAATPVVLGSFDTSGSAKSVVLSSDGAIAYVADDFSGLQIINVSDSALPLLLGTLDTSGRASDVKLSSDGLIAYVADDTGGVRVIDVSNVATPEIIGNLDSISAQSISLSKDGSKVYAFGYQQDLHVINVSEPVAPMLLHTLDVYGGDRPVAITLSSDNTKAYVANNSGLTVIDLTVDTVHLAKNFAAMNIPLKINSNDMQTLTLTVESDRTDILTVGNFSTDLPNASYDGVAVNIPLSSLADAVGQTILTVTLSFGTSTEVRKIYINVYP